MIKITKILTFTAFFIIYYFAFIIPTFAAEATKSATQSSSLIQKINELKAEIASKASLIKLEVNKKLQNKAYFGLITEINDQKITIQTKELKQNLILNEYTEFQTAKKKPNLADFEIKMPIVAIGDIDDKGNLVARKVIKLKDEELNSKIALRGIIETINGNKIVIKLNSAEKITLNISAKTLINLGGSESNSSEIKISKTVIASGILKDNILKTSFIYIIPTNSIIKQPKEKLNSTPSAIPKKQ